VLALVLALSSSLCWGVSDFVGGVQARRVPLLTVILVSQAIGFAGLLVLIAARGQGPPDLVRLLPAAAGGLAGIVALTGFYRALAIGTMSIVAPISATGVAVPVIVGVAGGERPAALQIAGIFTAVVGVILASREHGPGLEGHGLGLEESGATRASEEGGVTRASQDRGATRTSILLALAAAVGFGSFFVGVRASARADVLWALFGSRCAGVGGLVVAAALLRPAMDLGARALMPLAAMGILDLSANGLYALATRHGLLSVVAVAASLYPLATVLLARVLLGERVRRIQEVGIAAALVGVVLIAAG
jgi:drug/metabolite transporter (DMT)-like permease